ncbi:heme NO-binding domain-containing protein [Roseicyclus marinus]|uniref:heme NO-binding domain-containing protein n=1 Tax=Roseicyclus marinus TaxID=2161673 RepID=UPI00240F9D50|nr:heme NO-binding domain-containing protein [Roseicyclus marinus]MDG3040610.1 heme NO-binding domain-containing protein [Roseicyclus marinus]
MHGMVNRALQGFLTTTYGPDVWAEVRGQAGLPFADFEAMLDYPDALTLACFEAACHVLHKPPNALLEDIGTWLVTDPHLEPLRRLMRFSGAGFVDFLHSLEELGDRGRLAMPDLDLPQIALDRHDAATFTIRARWSLPGIGPILMGCLRAMADDYGALALLRLEGIEDGVECLRVQLLDTAFSTGRSFDLGRVGA